MRQLNIYLGTMYHHGDGAPQDDQLALKYYKLSAEQGNASAQFNLGRMYYLGKGVPQDYVVAFMWFNIAAASGLKDAISLRDTLSKEMTSSQIAEGQALSREWFDNFNKKILRIKVEPKDIFLITYIPHN